MFAPSRRLVFASSVSECALESSSAVAKRQRCRDRHFLVPAWNTARLFGISATFRQPRELAQVAPAPCSVPHPEAVDPLYLFACHVEWEMRDEPSSAWELLAATRSRHEDTRAQALALLGASRHCGATWLATNGASIGRVQKQSGAESEMKTPQGPESLAECGKCPLTRPGFFCGFPQPVREALDLASHKSVLPEGTILFVEGQNPTGVFIVCSGRVNLSTTSREGKVLILKTAEPGEVLGLSAAISGMGYDTTAETAAPSQLNFVERSHLLELMQSHSDIGLRASQYLSREFHTAFRDIHHLVLTRSSAGKLARLLLSQAPSQTDDTEARVASSMTHEEMAHRIGASRETVTRLLAMLKKKKLIRLDGSALVIRDRPGLESIAV